MNIKEKQLLKNTIIVSIGKICTQLVTFFLLPLYTSALTTKEYGAVDLLNTIIGLLLPIVTLQLEQGVFRFLIDVRNEYEKQKKIITSIFFIVLLQLLIVIILSIVIGPYIQNDYKYYLVLNLIAQVVSSIFLQVSRGLGDNMTYSVGSFISGLSTVLLNVFFITILKTGAYGMLAATFIGNVICSIFIFFKLKMYTFINIKEFDISFVKNVIEYSIPLIPNSISWWIVNASDRSIISIFLGVGANGIYSAANKFSNVLSTFYSVFNLTWTESASLYIDSKSSSTFFSRILDAIIRLFGGLCIIIIVYMPFIFPIMINESYGEAYLQIPILIASVFFNILVSFLGSIYIAKKITNEIAKTSIYAGIINIIVNLLLIKHIGLFAASISTAIAYFLMFLYRWFDSKKYIKILVNYKLIIQLVLIFVFVLISYYINNNILNMTMAIIGTMYVVYMNKQYIYLGYLFVKNQFF